MPIAAAIGISAAASLGGAALQSNAASNAASTQSDTALQVAQLQKQEQDQALAFQKQQYADSQKNFAPWLQSGQGALSNLDYLMGIGQNPNQGGGGAPPTSGPTAIQGATSPGLQVTNTGPVQAAPLGQSNLGASRPGAPVQSPIAGSRISPSGGSFNPLVQNGGANMDRVNLAQSTPGGLAQATPAGPGGTPTAAGGTTANAGMPAPNTGLGAYGSLAQGWDQQFKAPDNITMQNDPGFQARLNLGEQALNNSAAAKGNLLTGGTARDVNQFAQDYASNEYGNVYNRALGQYQQGYNIFENNQSNLYNRLASISGLGQTTANQLNSAGQSAANNISNTLLTGGAQQGQQMNNAAAATASGYIGSANAYGGALSGVGGNISNLLMLNQLLGGGGTAGATSSDPLYGIGSA